MALPYLLSPDNIPTGAAASVASYLQRRGLLNGATPGLLCETIDGKKWFRSLGGSDYHTHQFGTTVASVVVGFRYTNVVSASFLSGNNFGLAGGTSVIEWILLNDGRFICVRGGTTIGSFPIPPSGYIEVHAEATRLRAYLNGSATPFADVTFASVTGYSRVHIYRPQWSWRDFYVAEVRLGEGYVRPAVLTVSASTGTAGGTASSPSDGVASIDDTAKWTIHASGQETEQALTGSVTDNPVSIPLVQVTTLASKTEPGYLALTQEVNGGTDGSAKVLGLSPPTPHISTFATNPATSAAWTKATVNSAVLTTGG